ncbi:MAG TPA: hypothetical protein VF547_12195 [Allosphingosinicella sp.]|jgi:hypothetical protein
MTRLILVAAAGLLLATANTPPTTEGELSSVVAAPAPEQSATPAVHAKHAKPARPYKPAHAAAGAYPRCSATVRDRCQQGRGYAARPARQREIQYAMRAGERG